MGRGDREMGGECSVNGSDGEDFCSIILRPLTYGTVTTEAGSLFQYFTTVAENTDPLLWRRPRQKEGRKSKFRSISTRPLNILRAAIRSGPAAAVSLRSEGDACQ